SDDVFLVRFTAAGSVERAQRFGGGDSDRAGGVDVDAGGFVSVTGQFRGTVDFDPGAGSAGRTSLGGTDAFVVRLDPAGAFSLVVSYGSSGREQGWSVAAGAGGELFVAGSFTGTADFGPVAGTRASQGGRDAFLTRVALDPQSFPLSHGSLGSDTGFA